MDDETREYNPCQHLDDGRMERLVEKYLKSPCAFCVNRIILPDLSDMHCDCFVNGIIPEEIVSGRNNHSIPIVGQINDRVFTANESIKQEIMDVLRTMIARCQWTFAKAMPWCPHEYIVRGKCPLTYDEFMYFVDMQRLFGIRQRWGKYNLPYLHIDGYKYWTMDEPFEDTDVINREKE